MLDTNKLLNATSGPNTVWWPGLSWEIQNLVQQCRVCGLQRDNKHEPLIMTPLPDHPWQVVGTDLFELTSVDYRIVIHYYFSIYMDVAATQKTTKSSEVVRALKSIFARRGIPEQACHSLTVQNSATLPRNGDSTIAQVVLNFPMQNLEKLSRELELWRIS